MEFVLPPTSARFPAQNGRQHAEWLALLPALLTPLEARTLPVSGAHLINAARDHLITLFNTPLLLSLVCFSGLLLPAIQALRLHRSCALGFALHSCESA